MKMYWSINITLGILLWFAFIAVLITSKWISLAICLSCGYFFYHIYSVYIYMYNNLIQNESLGLSLGVSEVDYTPNFVGKS